MNIRWQLVLVRITRRLWFRAATYGAFGVITALIGALVGPLIPEGIAAKIGADAVGHILGILASSMLAVTTFSLSTMVSAYSSAATSATPRASVLLIEDAAAQRSLAGFIGVFLYSVVGLIALSAGLYGDSGRLVLFVATVLVIILIVGTLLRWIDQLSRLGLVSEIIDRVEKVTEKAMRAIAGSPCRGARSYDSPAGGAIELQAAEIGYLTHIDMHQLQTLAEEHDLEIWIECDTGHFVAPGQALVRLSRAVDAELREELLGAIVISDLRDFENDPSFGLVVLAEIGQRALSPGVNDPGTAIDVIDTATRLLCEWVKARRDAGPGELQYPRLFVRPLDEGGLIDQMFLGLAADSAPQLPVATRMQQALATLAGLGYPPFTAAAARQAERALALTDHAQPLESDRRHLHALAEWRLT